MVRLCVIDAVRDPGAMLADTTAQGLTLVPISAQLELFCPPYNPTSLMNVSWSCSS